MLKSYRKHLLETALKRSKEIEKIDIILDALKEHPNASLNILLQVDSASLPRGHPARNASFSTDYHGAIVRFLEIRQKGLEEQLADTMKELP
jgi:hypothetical protein